MKDTKTPKTPTSTTKQTTPKPSTPFTACFGPSSTSVHHHSPPPATPNLTTSLYHTPLGLFSLTWSRSLLSRSLHLHLHPHPSNLSLSSPSFHLSLNPFLFWNKRGLKKLCFPPSSPIWVFWDLTHARFGSGPDPVSGFYIAVLFQGEITLLVGDMENEAYLKTSAKKAKNSQKAASLVVRREHLVGKNKFYATRTEIGGKSRLICIELKEGCEQGLRLVIRFDQRRVVQVKHLKWKFRGNERIEFDGHPIQVSWNVYNWLFESEENNQDDGYALFTFRFEKQGSDRDGIEFEGEKERGKGEKGAAIWSQDYCGLNYERKKMKKRLMMKTRSPSFSSSSLSSASSVGSSVLEWESFEENELKGPTGFSLLVFAWKS